MNRELLLSNKCYWILYESSHLTAHSEFYSEEIFDASLVSSDERKSSMQDYSNWLRNEYLFIGNYSSEILLNGIDVVGPSFGRLERRLQNNYKIKTWQIDVNRFCNDIERYYSERLSKYEVVICIPNIEKNREIIINVFEQEGYYLINETQNKFGQSSDVSWICMFFVPMVERNVFYWVKDTLHLYCTCSYENVDDILKNGIVPDDFNKKRKYRPRTHFFIEEDKNRSYQYAKELYNLHPERGSEYALIEVDTSLLSDDSHFYFDWTIEGDSTVSTIDTINPACISAVEKFDTKHIVIDETYVPTKRELQNQKKAYKLIKEYQKDHPLIIHDCQFVSAAFNKTSDLKELWGLLKSNGICCSSFGRIQGGNMFTMFFRIY